ncbi:MAG TPA: trypsin-like peptidase domain-containing protein, partial [Bacillota bacterium]|nr:trypsin-like peptidase domain-containing protein [Bacillota bacterium]
MKTTTKRIWSWGLAVVAGAAALAATTRGLEAGNNDNGAKAKARKVEVKVSDTPVARDNKLTTSFSPVVKKAAPSVVNIFTTKKIKQRPEMMPFFGDPFFRRFFGEPGEDPRRERQMKQQSLGSGVIVTEDGYILTNFHVVDGADEIKVALPLSNKEYTAKLVGGDSKTDIAVLKVEAKGLVFATFSDSDKLEVGDV